MALDALVPVGGELIMLYAGVLAAGAISGQHATLFGAGLASGLKSHTFQRAPRTGSSATDRAMEPSRHTAAADTA